MARMFPEWISDAQRETNPARNAEFKVYDRLAHELSDDWYVFYSSVWTWTENKNRLGTREEDFVIAHPKIGILLLEVKGGRIGVQNGEWQSVDRGDHVWSIKNPYNQVAVAGISLSHRLNEEHPNPLKGFRFATAVCFPDTKLSSVAEHIDQNHQHLTIDAECLQDIQATLTAILQDENGQFVEPGELRILWLKELLAPTWYFSAPMSIQINNTEDAVKRLTEAQFKVLYDFAPNSPRLLITGCAGSGKTMLAAETAKRMVIKEHKKVLFVCYNRNLAIWLRSSSFFIDNGQMMVANYHKLCADFAHSAGLALPEAPGTSREDNQLYFAETLPNTLVEAAAKIGEQFDAIIVDEGQDFLESWWTSLLLLLKPAGRLHIYYDDNQRLWGPPRALPAEIILDMEPIILSTNVRNTKSIHNLAMKFHPSKGKGYEAHVGSSIDPEFVPVLIGESEQAVVRRLVERLTKQEGILPSHIAILTPLSIVEGNSIWQPNQTLLGRYRLVHHLNTAPHEIFCSSIGAAKGLEFPVVILTELYSPAIEKEILNIKSQMYVGVSRARSHLIILSSPEDFEQLMQ